MRLQNCQHPVRVYNKYLGEYVWTSCGKCPTCIKRYQNRWTARLENERKSSLFVLFVTLTYDDIHLPRLIRADYSDNTGKKVEAYRNADSSFLIPFHDLKFEKPADLEYFNKKMHAGGVPYADFRDVQAFNKRLNKFFHDKYTGKYENFRYFVVSELGKASLRPHYHGLYFFRSEIPSENFAEDIRSCWHDKSGNTIGNIEVECVEATASSYVSKYIGKLSHYPSFYQNDKIRCKFICSKRTPIGSLYELSETSSEIFHSSTISLCLPTSSGSALNDVPMPQYVKNRIFPKCPQFSRISHSLRVAVYRSASRYLTCGRWFGGSWKNNFGELIPVSFDSFLYNIRQIYLKYPYDPPTDFDNYIRNYVPDPYCEAGETALKRLYYMSKRVLEYCKKFFCTVEYYVHQIEEFYNKVEISTLALFYDFQQNYVEKHSLNEIENMYSEFAFNNQGDFRDCRFVDTQVDPICLSECEDFDFMCRDDTLDYKLSLWKHYFNAAKDSVICTDKVSKNLTLQFYYAKECNEIAQAIA